MKDTFTAVPAISDPFVEFSENVPQCPALPFLGALPPSQQALSYLSYIHCSAPCLLSFLCCVLFCSVGLLLDFIFFPTNLQRQGLFCPFHTAFFVLWTRNDRNQLTTSLCIEWFNMYSFTKYFLICNKMGKKGSWKHIDPVHYLDSLVRSL